MTILQTPSNPIAKKGIYVAPAEFEEADSLSAMFAEMVGEMPGIDADEKANALDYYSEFMTDVIANPKNVVLVGHDNQGLNGLAIASYRKAKWFLKNEWPDPANSLVLNWMFVRPDCRGQALIDGRRLSDVFMNGMKSHLSKKYDRLECVVPVVDTKANGVMARNGLYEAGPTPAHFKRWQYFRERRMRTAAELRAMN